MSTVRPRHKPLVALRQQRKFLQFHSKPTVVREVEMEDVHFNARHRVEDRFDCGDLESQASNLRKESAIVDFRIACDGTGQNRLPVSAMKDR